MTINQGHRDPKKQSQKEFISSYLDNLENAPFFFLAGKLRETLRESQNVIQ